MKYIVLTIMLTFCACGSVRHNMRIEKENHDLKMDKIILEQRCDSLQYEIWFLESDNDSLKSLLRRRTHRRYW